MPQAYIPYTVTAYANRAILVRTAVDPLSLLYDRECPRGNLGGVTLFAVG
jgi:hypothetical protein